MALFPAELIEPSGEIAPGLFPGESSPDLEARLQTYIADAQDRIGALPQAPAEPDEAARAWVYYRAFIAAANRMAAAPMNASLADQGSASYSPEQLRALRARAEYYLSRWTDLIAAPDALADTVGSRTLRVRFVP